MVEGSSASMSDRNWDDAAYRGFGLAGSRVCGRDTGL